MQQSAPSIPRTNRAPGHDRPAGPGRGAGEGTSVRQDWLADGTARACDLDGAASFLRSRRASIWQLEPGRLRASFDLIRVGRLAFLRAWFSHSVRIECEPFNAFVLIVPDGAEGLHLMGLETRLDAIAIRPMPDEPQAKPCEIVIPGCSRVWFVEIDRDLLADEPCRDDERVPVERQLTVLRGRAEELRQIIDRSFRSARTEQGGAHAMLHAREVETRILEAALPADSLHDASAATTETEPVGAVAIIETLVASYLASHEPFSVAGMCRMTGLSRRTLTYAFRKRYGVPPKRFFRSLALNEVRRALASTSAHARVSDVAPFFGFWHMSRFAEDYRNMFGELPSETLEKAHWSPRSRFVATA